MKKCRSLAALLALLLLLSGCTAEDWERIVQNNRIYALADKNAGRLAEEYILEKYAVEAEALGYDVDGSDVFMAYRARALATVALTDGEREFLVYLGLEDPEVRWDNYQAEEVAACLEADLLARLGLSPGRESRLVFRCAGDKTPGQVQMNGETRTVSGMLNFLYRGQSAARLLEGMTCVSWESRWIGGGTSLTGVTAPADWPEEVSLHLLLKEYRDEESYAAYKTPYLSPGGNGASVQENPALLETLVVSLEEGIQERSYARYDRFDADGLAFVGRAVVRGTPGEAFPEAGWVAGQVSYPQASLYWPAGEGGGEPCGPLFCCTLPTEPAEVEYSVSCTVLPAFFARWGDVLYYGACDAAGEQKIYRSLPFRPGQPGTYQEGNVYVRQTFWVGSGASEPVYYTFLRPGG